MNNNCHDNKIKKILEEGKKCNCTPIIVGPTGPTGPAGAGTRQQLIQELTQLLPTLVPTKMLF